jgi:long-chain acyl-CoA synthetase
MKIPEKLTFHAVLENSAGLYADRPALSFVGKQPLTYSEVKSQVEYLQTLLLAKGIQHGDRVALLSQNMPNWGVAYLAVTSMGAVIVPILTDFSTPEIVKILSHCEARSIIVSEKQVEKIQQELPETLQSAILLDDLSEISLGSLELGSKITSVPRRETDHSAHISIPREEDLAAILYTSGTTGTPKGVMLSHRNILSNAVNTLGIQRVDTSDRLLSVLPLPHTYECTIGFVIPFMTGASVYYLDKLATPSVLLPAMEKVKPTMMLTVPLIIEKVYQNRVLPKLTGSPFMRKINKFRPVQKLFHKLAGKKIYKAFGGKLHFFGVGGAKLNAATELFLRDAGFPYAIGYGLTETSPLLAGCGPKLTKYRSTGFNLPNQEIKILNPDPHTGEGEIIAKGPNVMMGYYKEPELTQEVFTDDGWFKTGDLGSFDEDGYLFIKGRLKNIIISATGENIYPEDIEAVINSEHHVLESLVYEIKGKLVARIHLNYEEIDQRYHELKTKAEKSYQEFKESAGQSYQEIRESAGQSLHEMKDSAEHMYEQAQQKVLDRLNEIKQRVNERLNRFSKVAVVEEQDKPFEKTPTKKIKRFLYQQQKDR